MSTLFPILFTQYFQGLLFAKLSSLIRVYTVCHSQQSDKGQGTLSSSETVWSGFTLFASLSHLINNISHSQSDQVLHYLPFSSVSILFTILSKQCYQGLQCLPFLAVRSGSTLFAILSSLVRVNNICYSQFDNRLHYLLFSSQIRVYTVCHSQQYDQCLHFFPFFLRSIIKVYCLPNSAVWTGSTLPAVWSGFTLFAILSSQISVYTICHSQSDQGLHCLPFSAVWAVYILHSILSSLIKVKMYTVILRNSPIKVYTICHSLQSDMGLHYLPFSALWSESALFAILCILIRVYTVFNSQHSDQSLHYLPLSAVWSMSVLSFLAV